MSLIFQNFFPKKALLLKTIIADISLFSCLQSTLCYYDVKDALALAPHNDEAQSLMKALQKRASENREQVIKL